MTAGTVELERQSLRRRLSQVNLEKLGGKNRMLFLALLRGASLRAQ